MIWASRDWLNNSLVLITIDLIHGHDHNNEMRPQLQPKKIKVRLYQPLMQQQNALHMLYITNKVYHFSFISGYVI